MFRLFLLFCLIFPSISEATTCRKDYGGTNSCVANDAPAGDCTTLGYSNKDVDGCTNYLYCPFDTSYKKCVSGGKELNCAELGYTKDNKSTWCSNIITCPNDSTLTACVSQCEYTSVCVDKSSTITTSMPANAQLKYTSCTACGQTSNIATDWECKTGYKKVTDYTKYGNCDQDFTRCLACNSMYVPYLNCQPYHECESICQWSGNCTSCDQYGTECDRCQDCYDECEASYTKKVQCSGGSCVYSDTCVDKTAEVTASMPTNAQLKYTNCTACGESRQIVTGWECSSGYGYITNAYTCGSTITSTTLRDPLCMHCNTKYVTYSDCARAIACKNATGKSCTVTPTGLVGC